MIVRTMLRPRQHGLDLNDLLQGHGRGPSWYGTELPAPD